MDNKLNMGFPGGSDLRAMWETWVQFLDQEDCLPGEGTGNPFQYSRLENPMDRGTWQTMEQQELDVTEQLDDVMWCNNKPKYRMKKCIIFGI